MRREFRIDRQTIAERRLKRTLNDCFCEYLAEGEPRDHELLLAVLEDFLDLRQKHPQDQALSCMRTAFNLAIRRSRKHFITAGPEILPDVLAFIKWRTGLAEENRKSGQKQ